jgi:hypothetical protein
MGYLEYREFRRTEEPTRHSRLAIIGAILGILTVANGFLWYRLVTGPYAPIKSFPPYVKQLLNLEIVCFAAIGLICAVLSLCQHDRKRWPALIALPMNGWVFLLVAAAIVLIGPRRVARPAPTSLTTTRPLPAPNS